MSAPTPGARERLLAWAKVEGFRSDQRANLLIAAQDIEAEARAALRAELAAAVDGLEWFQTVRKGPVVYLAAVLRLIEGKL